ncbi:hypothetical protein QFZ80_005758 [Paenibacillus sp. V4I7]|nr:hypothetical protein [Paenibacillus sp. V4I7]
MQVTLLNNDPTNIALMEIFWGYLITGIPKTANIHEVFTLNPNETTYYTHLSSELSICSKYRITVRYYET